MAMGQVACSWEASRMNRFLINLLSLQKANYALQESEKRSWGFMAVLYAMMYSVRDCPS